MISLGDLKGILNGNTLSYTKITASSLANIMTFVDVTLEMDRSSLDYYYKIDVEDILNSNISKDELEEIKNQGWSFSDDGKSLIVFLKNK